MVIETRNKCEIGSIALEDEDAFYGNAIKRVTIENGSHEKSIKRQ